MREYHYFMKSNNGGVSLFHSKNTLVIWLHNYYSVLFSTLFALSKGDHLSYKRQTYHWPYPVVLYSISGHCPPVPLNWTRYFATSLSTPSPPPPPFPTHSRGSTKYWTWGANYRPEASERKDVFFFFLVVQYIKNEWGGGSAWDPSLTTPHPKLSFLLLHPCYRLQLWYRFF